MLKKTSTYKKGKIDWENSDRLRDSGTYFHWIQYLWLGHQNSVENFEDTVHLCSTPYFKGSRRIGTGYQQNKESSPAVKNDCKSVNMRIQLLTLYSNYNRGKMLGLPLALSNQILDLESQNTLAVFSAAFHVLYPYFLSLSEGELLTHSIIIALFYCGKAVK